jgi:preprotein translocase subunit SecG
MTVIYGFLIVLEALVSALLIGVIFLQKSKGGMGGAAFGGGVGEAIFGSRMGNVLTKATVVLAVIFLANTIVLTMLTARRKPAASVTDMGLVVPSSPVAPMSMPGPAPIEPMSIPVPVDVPADVDVPVVVPVAAAAPVAAPVAAAPVAPAPVETPAAAPAE